MIAKKDVEYVVLYSNRDILFVKSTVTGLVAFKEGVFYHGTNHSGKCSGPTPALEK